MNRLLVLTFVLVLPLTARAAEDERAVRIILGLGLSDGGSRVEYSGGTSTIRAGEGRLMYAGALVRLGDRASLQATLGTHRVSTYSFWIIERESFNRNIGDLVLHYHLSEKLRLGGGAEFISNARLRGISQPSVGEQNYERTVGAIVEGEYRFRPWFGLKLRGVTLRYKASDSDIRFNGDHVALLCSFYL